MSVFNVTDFTDNSFINIYPIGGDFVAASESDVVLSFDPETLETKDRVSERFSLVPRPGYEASERFSVNGNYCDYHSGQT